jgi:hypothetical protein
MTPLFCDEVERIRSYVILLKMRPDAGVSGFTAGFRTDESHMDKHAKRE